MLMTPGATPGTGYQFPTTPITLSQASNTPGNSETTRWGTPKGPESKHSETPTPGRSIRKSRWDLTPSTERGTPKTLSTPDNYQSTPGLSTPGLFNFLFISLVFLIFIFHMFSSNSTFTISESTLRFSFKYALDNMNLNLYYCAESYK